MPEEAEEKLEVQQGEVYVNTPVEIPRFYTSHAEVTFSTLDMYITFGEIVANQENKKVVQRVARVTMSLEHAKTFVDVLYKGLARFENLIGQEIPTFQMRLEEMVKAEAKTGDALAETKSESLQLNTPLPSKAKP